MPEHNFIIPCGTSQIEADKFSRLDLSSENNDRVNQFLNEVKNTELDTQNFFTKYSDLAFAIVEKLVQIRQNNQGRLTLDSPFGAEISTLDALPSLTDWNGWDAEKKEDTYVILSSNTGPGFFCAQVLRSLLIDPRYMAIPEEKVSKPVIVDRLKDSLPQPEDASKALRKLVVRIRENMVFNAKQNNPQRIDVFIMTGGYKSIIPYLTLFSLFYGIEMVYLFEHSTWPQSIFPKISFSTDDKKKWLDLCQKLASMNSENETIKQLILDELREPPGD